MKKYDLILAVLYILPVILGFIIFYNLKNPSDQEMEKAGAYIEKLYKQPVSNVVIYNTDMAVRVIESPEKVKQGFKITGVIPFRQVTGFRVAGDTLYVSGPEEYSGVICQLWVSPGVKVDTRCVSQSQRLKTILLIMDFKETQAIYLQIVDLVCDHIVTGKWKAQERIPSVRELGVQLEVNPNTVMRAYDYLQAREIICNKRGVGFFVTEGASKQITESRREEFVGTELPDIFRRMSLLAIPIELVVVEYEKYKAGNNS